MKLLPLLLAATCTCWQTNVLHLSPVAITNRTELNYHEFKFTTNWTGHVTGDNGERKELGYVQLNHWLTTVWRQHTNTFLVESNLSNTAVWRAPQVTSVTNGWMVLTNWGNLR